MLYRIKTGQFAGRIGYIKTTPKGWKLGNVMFYPIEGACPYRVCVKFSDLEEYYGDV